MSLGAASVFHQASILELYDPDRSQAVRRGGEISSWEEFLADLVPALAEQSAKQGAGLRILTETVSSPTLAAQIGALLKEYPQAKWHQYEPWNRDNLRSGLARSESTGRREHITISSKARGGRLRWTAISFSATRRALRLRAAVAARAARALTDRPQPSPTDRR